MTEKLSKQDNNVNPSKLIASNINGFYELKNDPSKIIRIQSFNNIKETYGNNTDPKFVVELAKKLFNEIETNYNIPTPVEFVVGKNEKEEDVVYCITDKIEGESLDKIERTPELIKKIEDLYTSISKYYFDKFNTKEAHLADINATSQYVYGKKKGDVEPKIYLVDTDLYINKGDVALLHNVKWLVRHMPFKINEAEKYIREIIQQPLSQNLSDAEKLIAQKEIKESLNFLNGTYKQGDEIDDIGFISTLLY